MKVLIIEIGQEYVIGWDIDIKFWQDPPIGRDHSNYSTDKIVLIKWKSGQSVGIDLLTQINCQFNMLSTEVKVLNMKGQGLSCQDLRAQPSQGATKSLWAQTSKGGQDQVVVTKGFAWLEDSHMSN